MIYLLLSWAAFLGALVILRWLHTQWHLDIVVHPAAPPTNAPFISVIVPARNEERNIRRCVQALLNQSYPNYEILVLDDRSADATPRILAGLQAASTRLRTLHGSELPAGWAGKPHALHQAAKEARGDWLLFLDADTFLAPNALAAVTAKALETGADVFTIMNRQIMETFWERAVLPLVFTALSVGFTPRKVNDPRQPDAIANGQFLMMKRPVYDAVGGHAAIRHSIVEDKDMAVLVKRSGHRLVVADGRQVAATRMYTSLPEMWEGWTKNIYLGLKDQPGLLALGAFGAFLALMAALFMPVWPLLGLIWLLNGGGWMAVGVMAAALGTWGYLIYWRALAARDMGIPAWYALTTPLGAGVFAGMMLTSAWNVLSGKGVTWKGRTYKK